MASRKLGAVLFGRKRNAPPPEERLNQNDWASMWAKYNGHTYALTGSMPRGSKEETPDNNFVGYINGAYKSSGVVFASMLARQLIFSEARITYQKFNAGKPGDIYWDDALDLFLHPWPNADTGELLARAIQDVDLAGNHYVVKEFIAATTFTRPHFRLRRLRPDWVTILLTAPPDEARKSDVAGYLYRPGMTDERDKWEVFPIDGSNGQVAHWSYIPDPDAQYRGMSPLTPVLRDIAVDKAATHHKAKFFENAATPNLAVSFKETVSNEEFKELMQIMNETKHGVEHAYETLYLGGGADVEVIGANIQQMDFRSSLGHSETRVAMALRVHPTIVGMAEGMHGSTLNDGNFKAAKNLLADGAMRPMWRSLMNAYSVLIDVPAGARLWYDASDVAFLRQDRLETAEIQQIQSQTISAYIQSGYTADSARDAVVHNDASLLEHTGLFSVQLLPPGTVSPTGGNADTAEPNSPASKGDGKANPKGKAPAQPAKAQQQKAPAKKPPSKEGS
jgi:phage portal protein BeeE